jgi:N6-adenosine-specific RNA methylase IME4
VWNPSSRHGFAVKSYYTMSQSDEHSLFLWKNIWQVKVPRTAFFLWATASGRILTVDNLKRQGFQLINQCCLCKKDEETINHLFLHCEYAANI